MSASYKPFRGMVLRMKWFVLVLGILLIAAGVFGLAHPTITYHQNEEVARVGPIQATVQKEKTAQIPMILSLVELGAGITLVVLMARRKG